MLLFGCIADDFTGASDAASFLQEGGLGVQLFSGVPSQDVSLSEGMDAAVIALKSRTQEKELAVSDSLWAAGWLLKKGAQKLYFKYCSTFDSTPKGNIGPVADALLELTKAPYTVLCPSLPVNGRTVRSGELFVNGTPLADSPMKDHPLTPMRESRIKLLMEAQSRYSCLEIWKETLHGINQRSLSQFLMSSLQTGKPFYVIPDYIDDADARQICALFGDLPFLTGGSGLLKELAYTFGSTAAAKKAVVSPVSAPAVLLAGSCSKATLSQIAYYQSAGGTSLKINPERLLNGSECTEDYFRFFDAHKEETVLFYSSDIASHVKKVQEAGSKERVAALLENAIAAIAEYAVSAGVKRIITAGGETSGAVTERLGFTSFLIGESVAPGVPIMQPTEDKSLRLVLKSGNFGSEDFFTRALEMTGGKCK